MVQKLSKVEGEMPPPPPTDVGEGARETEKEDKVEVSVLDATGGDPSGGARDTPNQEKKQKVKQVKKERKSSRRSSPKKTSDDTQAAVPESARLQPVNPTGQAHDQKSISPAQGIIVASSSSRSGDTSSAMSQDESHTSGTTSRVREQVVKRKVAENGEDEQKRKINGAKRRRTDRVGMDEADFGDEDELGASSAVPLAFVALETAVRHFLEAFWKAKGMPLSHKKIKGILEKSDLGVDIMKQDLSQSLPYGHATIALQLTRAVCEAAVLLEPVCDSSTPGFTARYLVLRYLTASSVNKDREDRYALCRHSLGYLLKLTQFIQDIP